MAKKEIKYDPKPRLGYRMLKAYVRFFHDKWYYRNVYWLNTDNVPDDGVPVMIVSDHQNGLNDPLGTIFSVHNRKKRKMRFVARADVFRKIFQRPLSWLGILPAYRAQYQGEGSAARNRFMLGESGEELIQGGAVVIYPEAGHQDKRWLGSFSAGYLHLIFEAARKTGFEKEMFVLPSCNHYSDYVRFREQLLIKYGTPISLAPYYKLYEEDQKAAQNAVNAVIREQISDLMLNITDLENYDAIDFLRETYGVGYARKQGYNPRKLPDKLLSDKELFARMDSARQEWNEDLLKVYDDARELSAGETELKLEDRFFSARPALGMLLLKGLGMLMTFPLFVIALVPNILVYLAPKLMTRRIEDIMLHGGINLALSILVTMPVLYIAMFFVTQGVTGSWIAAGVHFLALPWLAVFAWNYSQWFLKWLKGWRFRGLDSKGRLDVLRKTRERIYSLLDSVLAR